MGIGKNIIMIFIDLEKAYDNVRRDKVWEALNASTRVPDKEDNERIRGQQVLHENASWANRLVPSRKRSTAG